MGSQDDGADKDGDDHLTPHFHSACSQLGPPSITTRQTFSR